MKPFIRFLLRSCRCGRLFESWAEAMSRDERDNAVCAACIDGIEERLTRCWPQASTDAGQTDSIPHVAFT